MKKTMKLAAGATLLLTGAANAAVYDITGVLNGVDNGFGFSGFHFAGEDNTSSNSRDYDGNAMTGSSLAGFDGVPVSGSYNDMTGDLSMVLTLTGATGTVALTGTGFIYDGSGVLSAPASLDVVFSNPTSELYDTTIDFDNSIVCCSSADPAPNSFNGSQLSLWGADFPDPNLGLDLRLQLTPVPVPAAVWLFGSGLLGLIGIARRKV